MGESTLIDWIFGGHDKPFRDLDEDVRHRAQVLDIYFRGMELTTTGKINLERLVGSGSVLDLGMGRGALAILLRSKGMQGKIVGVDETHYDGVTGYELYDRKEFQPIESLVAGGRLANEEFEYVVCFAPTPDVLDWIKTSGNSIPIRSGGQFIIATEHDVEGFDQFEEFQGPGGYKHYLLREY